jgi:hypothetical protein
MNGWMEWNARDAFARGGVRGGLSRGEGTGEAEDSVTV